MFGQINFASGQLKEWKGNGLMWARFCVSYVDKVKGYVGIWDFVFKCRMQCSFDAWVTLNRIGLVLRAQGGWVCLSQTVENLGKERRRECVLFCVLAVPRVRYGQIHYISLVEFSNVYEICVMCIICEWICRSIHDVGTLLQYVRTLEIGTESVNLITWRRTHAIKQNMTLCVEEFAFGEEVSDNVGKCLISA